MKARFVTAALLLATAAAATHGVVIYAAGTWAALDRGGVCEALSRSAKIAPQGRIQAIAGLSFSPDHKRWGEFHVALSRVPRMGSSVVLKVGGQPFLLAGNGNWAWSRGPAQEQAIIAALRSGGGMSVEARDEGGVRFVDPYGLDGAATAIDAAAARCALRGAGKIQ